MKRILENESRFNPNSPSANAGVVNAFISTEMSELGGITGGPIAGVMRGNDIMGVNSGYDVDGGERGVDEMTTLRGEGSTKYSTRPMEYGDDILKMDPFATAFDPNHEPQITEMFEDHETLEELETVETPLFIASDVFKSRSRVNPGISEQELGISIITGAAEQAISRGIPVSLNAATDKGLYFQGQPSQADRAPAYVRGTSHDIVELVKSSKPDIKVGVAKPKSYLDRATLRASKLLFPGIDRSITELEESIKKTGENANKALNDAGKRLDQIEGVRSSGFVEGTMEGGLDGPTLADILWKIVEIQQAKRGPGEFGSKLLVVSDFRGAKAKPGDKDGWIRPLRRLAETGNVILAAELLNPWDARLPEGVETFMHDGKVYSIGSEEADKVGQEARTRYTEKAKIQRDLIDKVLGELCVAHIKFPTVRPVIDQSTPVAV